MHKLSGKVWKYGDDVNTDVIYPGKYLYTISDPKEMAGHALEGLDPAFSEKMESGDIIVAGKNWGCGSSREQAVICLKEKQVGAIIAASFGRIFYRNCLNSALIAIACPEAAGAVDDKEKILIDLEKGEIHCRAGVFAFQPLPGLLREIIDLGGLVPYVRRELEKVKRRSQ